MASSLQVVHQSLSRFDRLSFTILFKAFTDTVLRLNPRTGEFVEYLLPSFTNVRRVFVDNSSTLVAFWAGNNHGASVVKLELLN
jgi:hypothetical protein